MVCYMYGNNVSQHKAESILYLSHTQNKYTIPLYTHSVRAGFPSPADDYIETYLDLNTHLVKHPAATFFLKASGDSMIHAGIREGDLLVVDKSLEATPGKVVIAVVNGELTVKQLVRVNGGISLVSAKNNYKPIMVNADDELLIWGVVTHVIHALG